MSASLTGSRSYGVGRDLSRHGLDRVQNHDARCAGLPGSRAAAAKGRRLAPAPCVVGEDLGAGFGPLDLVEPVSVVRVHCEGLPSDRFFAVSLSRRADASEMDAFESSAGNLPRSWPPPPRRGPWR